VEKPFTSTLAEAEELFHLAHQKGLIAMPFQNRRFDGDFLALKEVLQSKEAGGIVELESHFDYFRKDVAENPGSPLNGSFGCSYCRPGGFPFWTADKSVLRYQVYSKSE
jgi:predicted dehydrogenase